MMPGMAPPGPPTAYLPGPFMQPMPYPPGMPSPGLSTVKKTNKLRLMSSVLVQLCTTLLLWDKCRVSLKLQIESLVLKTLCQLHKPICRRRLPQAPTLHLRTVQAHGLLCLRHLSLPTHIHTTTRVLRVCLCHGRLEIHD